MATKYLATAGWANTGEFASAWGDDASVKAEYYDRPAGYWKSANQHLFQIELAGRRVTAITLIRREGEVVNEPCESVWHKTGRKLSIGDTW